MFSPHTFTPAPESGAEHLCWSCSKPFFYALHTDAEQRIKEEFPIGSKVRQMDAFGTVEDHQIDSVNYWALVVSWNPPFEQHLSQCIWPNLITRLQEAA